MSSLIHRLATVGLLPLLALLLLPEWLDLCPQLGEPYLKLAVALSVLGISVPAAMALTILSVWPGEPGP